MPPEQEQHPWSDTALLAKARAFISLANAADPASQEAGIWSALGVESLARAALSHFNILYLADFGKNHSEALSALDYTINSVATSRPVKSISVTTVFGRLKTLLPEFSTVTDFCYQHIRDRNAEVHTGSSAFGGDAKYWPAFYKACSILVSSLGEDLSLLFDDMGVVNEAIEAHNAQLATSVNGQIASFRDVWDAKDEAARTESNALAHEWATKHRGHRVSCPACECQAILYGRPTGPPTANASDEDWEITVTQRMHPKSFQCIACGLKLTGFATLLACDLGQPFTLTVTSTPTEYYEDLYTEDDLRDRLFEEFRSGWHAEEMDYNE